MRKIMESSELFLIAWSVMATILAVYCQHRAKQFKHRAIMFEISLLAIAHKKAEVFLDGDTVSVRGV